LDITAQALMDEPE